MQQRLYRPRVVVVLLLLVITMATESEQQQPQINFTVKENCGAGYELGRIDDELNLVTDAPRTYQIVDDRLHLIAIDGDGTVTFAHDVDREEICSVKSDKFSPSACKYSMNAAVMYPSAMGAAPTFFAIKLTIDDENDNEPTFDRELIEKTISENAQIGSVIRLTSATDRDVGVNDVRGYELLISDDELVGGESLPFTLHNYSNGFGLLIPELYLERKLDREVVTSYKMTVRCFDGGTPPLYGDVEVKVHVTDVNDNAPHFDQVEYTAEVHESAPPGKEIIQVRATDDDDGNNAKIEYEFSADSTGKENFLIDRKSGWISLSKTLDYEKTKTHHLSVVAGDIGSNPLQAFATVTIKVLNVNDEAPQIRVKFLNEIKVVENPKAPNTIRLSEDAIIGTQIAFVTLTDAGGEEVECELENADDVTEGEVPDDVKLRLQPLDSKNSYLLRVAKPLDREEKRTLLIRIVAHDNGTPVKSNSTILRISLIDVNDNPPKFSSDVIQVGVNESALPGDVVKEILASDLDYLENKRISYTWRLLSHRDHYGDSDVTEQFVIEKDTGVVRLGANAGGFDAETKLSNYIFNLTATDHGEPPLHSSTIVNITVKDVNDNAPKFIGEPYSFLCDENVKTNHRVGIVRATDADIDKLTNGKVDYSLQSCPPQSCPFNIVPSTGEILFNGDSSLIDREARKSSNFNFIVQAMDRGEYPKRQLKQATVEVMINDVNDNVAVVTSPDYLRQFAHINVKLTDPQSRETMSDDVINDVLLISFGRKTSRPTSFPLNILRMEVDDVDKNVTITYDVIGGDQHGKFVVGESNGKLTLNVQSQADLDDLTDGCHVITVAVHDRGLPHDHVIETPVNIYVEKEGTTEKKNSTEILSECSRSAFYPKMGAEDGGGSDSNPKVTQVTLLVIIFGSILLFLVIIMVVMILKYRCRSNKHHRSYNCKDANDLYQAQSLTHPNHSSVERHSRMENFYTDENGRQLHLQQAGDKRGSPPSDGGGRDSGTGDSMPHQPLDGEYMDDATKQLIYHQQQQRHQQLRHHATSPTSQYQQQQQAPMMMTSRCTEECQINGHGDDCWMPMETSGDGYEMMGGEMVELHHPGYMTSQVSYHQPSPNEYTEPQIRYHHHHATPYYYDPVSNFDNQQQSASQVAKQPSYRNSPVMMTSQQDNYHYPLHSTSLARNLNASFASQRNIRSPQPPVTSSSSGVRYIQGKAYVNLQGGYDDVSSSNGSGNYRMHPTTPSVYDDDERALMTSYMTQQDGYYDGGGYHVDNCNESQFTAANLLISPMAPPTGDNHHYQPPASSSPSPTSPGTTNNDVTTTSPTTTTLAPASGDDITGDKLSTIREEIDAEEVVAQIDGLLL